MLKAGEIILIETQEELNLLAGVIDGVCVDALHINEEYVAFVDEVVNVVPLKKLKDENHFMSNIKPKKFKVWYKRIKRRLEKWEELQK